MTQPQCGVREADLPGGVAQLWHCAASLRYEDRYADEIRAANIDGTRQALALADRLGVGAFNYVSTNDGAPQTCIRTDAISLFIVF